MIQITQKGELAVEQAHNLMTPRGAVLSILYEIRQGVELEDLRDQTGMDDVKLATVVRSLINDGLAKEVLPTGATP